MFPLLNFVNRAILSAMAYSYLIRGVLPEAPKNGTNPQPYVPPFTGGQCLVQYRVHILMAYNGNYNQFPYRFSYTQMGKVSLPTMSTSSGVFALLYPNGTRVTGENFGGERRTWKIERVERVDNMLDNCGDMQNPVVGDPTAISGITSSTPYNGANLTNLSNSDSTAAAAAAAAAAASQIQNKSLIDGVLALLAALGEAIAALLGSGQALANGIAQILNGIAGLSFGIARILSAITYLIDLINQLKKMVEDMNPQTKKETAQYDFGSIRGDGYLSIYPSGMSDELICNFVDLQIKVSPLSMGREFGGYSPHYYSEVPFGRIMFVSPSLGVLSTSEINYARTSFGVPSGAIGFYYHLGLTEQVVANSTAFYIKIKNI